MRPSKRDELVEGALAIFERGGFHATGVDAVAAACKMSKTSIYNHFSGKDELILAALGLRDERFLGWLTVRAEELARDPAEQLLAVFDALGEWFARPDFNGCAFIKAGAEFQDADNPIHAFAAEHKRRLLSGLADRARKAGLKKPKAVARRLLLLVEGAITGAHLGCQKDPAGDARAVAELVIDAARK